MPALETRITKPDRRTLQSRKNRAFILFQNLTITEPPKMALRLRREIRRLESDFDAAEDQEMRVELFKVLDVGRERMMQLLGWPKRPGRVAGRDKPVIPVLGQVQDAEMAEPAEPNQPEAQPESEHPTE